jgi:SAM-dependent methyltransferase
MGIGKDSQALLANIATRLKPGFSVCELGDQLIATKKNPPGSPRKFERGPAEPFYRSLGCGEYVTIDANGNATILADLNLPLDPMPGPFDLVTNWGTTEHVFDFAQCWETLHDLTRAGGFLVFEQPSQGYLDHGLYCPQPTLFRDIARHNGYEIAHFDTPKTDRGMLVRAAFRKLLDQPFQTPTQGRYKTRLKV